MSYVKHMPRDPRHRHPILVAPEQRGAAVDLHAKDFTERLNYGAARQAREAAYLQVRRDMARATLLGTVVLAVQDAAAWVRSRWRRG